MVPCDSITYLVLDTRFHRTYSSTYSGCGIHCPPGAVLKRPANCLCLRKVQRMQRTSHHDTVIVTHQHTSTNLQPPDSRASHDDYRCCCDVYPLLLLSVVLPTYVPAVRHVLVYTHSSNTEHTGNALQLHFVCGSTKTGRRSTCLNLLH